MSLERRKGHFAEEKRVYTLDGQNRQSPIASVQRNAGQTLASHSAYPRGTNTTPMKANRAIRIAAQRTQGLRGTKFCVLRGRYDRQRMLVIRIAAITLAGDSAITLARFRPSKVYTTTVAPSFLFVCRPTPTSQSKKTGYGVYHFPEKTREEGIHHRSGKKGIQHRASDPGERIKGGFPRWWCILFSFPVLVVDRNHFGGFRDPKTAQMPAKQGKPNKTTIALITGINLKSDQMTIKLGKNAKRTNGSIFTQPQPRSVLEPNETSISRTKKRQKIGDFSLSFDA